MRYSSCHTDNYPGEIELEGVLRRLSCRLVSRRKCSGNNVEWRSYALALVQTSGVGMAESDNKERMKERMAAAVCNSQTGAPKDVMHHLKIVAVQHYDTLRAEFLDMFRKFLKVRPWEMTPPLPWRAPLYHQGPGNSIASGWVAVNILLPRTLKDEIDAEIQRINDNGGIMIGGKNEDLSYRVFAYTAIWWWAKFIYVMK